jgi:DNA-binding transcriptional regulator YbjK
MSAATHPSTLPRAELRRREILSAVLRVVAAGGVDAVTHRRVAAEAGVSLGSTTYHFDSRDELILEAFRFLIANENERMAEFGSDFAVNDLESFVEALVAWSKRELADRARLVAEYELILHASRDERLAREYWAWRRSLESLAAESLERFGIHPAVEIGRLLVGVIRLHELEGIAHRPTGPDDLRRRLRLILGCEGRDASVGGDL